MNFVKQSKYKPTQKLVWPNEQRKTYDALQDVPILPQHGNFKQSKKLAKYIDQNTQKRNKAKTNLKRDLSNFMNNAFFGKTMENVRDRTKLEFIDHSQIQQIIKRQFKLSFKVLWIGILRLVSTSSIRKNSL